MSTQFLFPAEFTPHHRKAIVHYTENPIHLSARDWVLLIATFNLLKRAVVVVDADTSLTFARIYRQVVEDRYATPYISALYEMHDLPSQSNALWATSARQIVQDLSKAGLYKPTGSDSWILLAYCLYWWYAFAKGYAFEMEIFRDLSQSELSFQFHDLRDRDARLSPFDLQISQFKGDVKLSTYFLLDAATREPNADFYITRLWRSAPRQRTLVVFLQDLTWEEIDGETLAAALDQVDTILPLPVRIPYRKGALIVVEYELWREKMGLYQQRRETR